MTKPNRRVTDPKCMEAIWVSNPPVLGETDTVTFYCARLKGHQGPHIHRGVGEDRVYGKPVVNTNFNVAWMTKK